MTSPSLPPPDTCPAGAQTPERPTPSPAVPLAGIVPPLATPLLAPDRLDIDGLERLINHLVAGGVHGLFILGTTGEGPSLSQPLRRELVSSAIAVAAGRLPVLVGISDAAIADSLALAHHAADAGAAAVVAAPPFYFPASQDQLGGWARELAARTPLPLLLYNMPEMVKTVIEPVTLAGLADCEQIVGLKDSGGDLATFAAYAEVCRRQRPDWGLFIGPELLYPDAHRLGATGAVPGGANVLPAVFVELHAALHRGDPAAVARLIATAQQLSAIYTVSPDPGQVIVGIKAALLTLGICGDATASPFSPLPPADIARVWDIVSSLLPTAAGGDSPGNSPRQQAEPHTEASVPAAPVEPREGKLG